MRIADATRRALLGALRAPGFGGGGALHSAAVADRRAPHATQPRHRQSATAGPDGDGAPRFRSMRTAQSQDRRLALGDYGTLSFS